MAYLTLFLICFMRTFIVLLTVSFSMCLSLLAFFLVFYSESVLQHCHNLLHFFVYYNLTYIFGSIRRIEIKYPVPQITVERDRHKLEMRWGWSSCWRPPCEFEINIINNIALRLLFVRCVPDELWHLYSIRVNDMAC